MVRDYNTTKLYEDEIKEKKGCRSRDFSACNETKPLMHDLYVRGKKENEHPVTLPRHRVRVVSSIPIFALSTKTV